MENQWALCHVDSSFDASLLGNKGSQWHWFHQRDDLIEYLLNDYIYLLADTGELDEYQTENARERFELLVEQSRNDQELMEQLNDLTVNLRRIVWFGTLAQLAEIDDEFANALRSYFWYDYGDNEDDPEAAVPEELWPEFTDVIDEFLIEGEYS